LSLQRTCATATAAGTHPAAPGTTLVTETRAAGGWGTFTVPPRSTTPREIHVAPLFGPAHSLAIECWCHPSRDPDDTRLVVHNVAH
jgi:hypothetical protein